MTWPKLCPTLDSWGRLLKWNESSVALGDCHVCGGAPVAARDRLALDYQALVSQARGRILHPSIPSDATPGLEPNTYDDVDYISPIGAYAVHGHIVEREALARGLNSWRFTKSSIMVSDTAGVQLPLGRLAGHCQVLSRPPLRNIRSPPEFCFGGLAARCQRAELSMGTTRFR